MFSNGCDYKVCCQGQLVEGAALLAYVAMVVDAALAAVAMVVDAALVAVVVAVGAALAAVVVYHFNMYHFNI